VNSINLAPVRLTRDPERKTLPGGTTVCELRIAYNARRQDAEGGWVDDPHFFTTVAYGVLADTLAEHLAKGSRIALSGRLRHRTWNTADNQARGVVEIVAQDVRFLDPAPSDAGPQPVAVGAHAGDEDIPF
jgi:single-strand DNA-binding protein